MTDSDNGTHRLGAFPDDFVWGAATSAYQIEGATTTAGRGQSIWDKFAHSPGRVADGTTGDVAIDSYHRYPEDIAVMRQLGISAYRYSISWPRVQPTGDATINQAGIDHYAKFTDALLEAGIDPWITLYHWDLPQSLEDAGGWPARDTAYRFADFAALMHERLGDRVHNWITVNEPWCAAFLGYASGEHAPGRREPAASIAAAHHLMLAHGLATTAMRADRDDTRIGVGLNFYPIYPASPSEADADAVRRIDGMQNRFFTDAVLRGEYPADVLTDLSAVTPLDMIEPDDLKIIGVPIDLLCVNYYSRFTVSGDKNGQASASAAPTDVGSAWPGNEHIGFIGSDLPLTGMGWEIDPGGLREMLTRLSRDYPGIPLVVTENGSAFDDTLVDGRVADQDRLAYLRDHVDALAQALAADVPLEGYFAWSLMDNFEWAWGYDKRFGLVHVDFDTQQRVIKDSGHWYADLIAGRPTALFGGYTARRSPHEND